MKVLIIGSGGREHALAEVYSQSKKVDTVFAAPGNALMPETNKKIKTVTDIAATDLKKLLSFAKKEKIDLVDVAADDQLAAGYVDAFQKEGFKVFGPSKKAAEIEWNKSWARSFMQKYKLPIPEFKSFSNQKDAIAYIKSKPKQLFFIKASGLAAGKGVIRADTKKQAFEAIKAMKQFNTSGKTFLIEEGMVGEEFSLFAICDGDTYKVIGTAQDHKTVYDNDQGPNTGGMGCVCPTGSLKPATVRKIEKDILKPFVAGMKKEGRPYTGILYLGGMITKKGIRIVEFNARWGDPEAEVILPSLLSDYVDLIKATLSKNLHKYKVKQDNKIRISIAGCSRGYPENYAKVKGKKISGIPKVFQLPGITVFGAGISCVGKSFVVNGGRVFHLVAEGTTIQQARKKAYDAMKHIAIERDNLHFRTDIGWREIERKS